MAERLTLKELERRINLCNRNFDELNDEDELIYAHCEKLYLEAYPEFTIRYRFRGVEFSVGAKRPTRFWAAHAARRKLKKKIRQMMYPKMEYKTKSI